MTINLRLGRIFIEHKGLWYTLYLNKNRDKLVVKCYKLADAPPVEAPVPVMVLRRALIEMLRATGLTPLEYREIGK